MRSLWGSVPSHEVETGESVILDLSPTNQQPPSKDAPPCRIVRRVWAGSSTPGSPPQPCLTTPRVQGTSASKAWLNARTAHVSQLENVYLLASVAPSRGCDA